jgi:hypothetical protein
MKYIVSESQYRLIKEQDQNFELWFKRRTNPEFLKFFIDSAIADEPNPCDDYTDKFDYAFNRIDWAVTELLSTNEEFHNSEEFDEHYTILVDLCKEWFSERLFNDYRNTCVEEDFEDEEDFEF